MPGIHMAFMYFISFKEGYNQFFLCSLFIISFIYTGTDLNISNSFKTNLINIGYIRQHIDNLMGDIQN